MKLFDAFLKRDPIWVHARSQLGALTTIPDGIAGLVKKSQWLIQKYIIAYIRIMRPVRYMKMASFQPYDLLAECVNDKGGFHSPPDHILFYTHDSLKTELSSFLSGVTRYVIAQQAEVYENMREGDPVPAQWQNPPLIHINTTQWTQLKTVREKLLTTYWDQEEDISCDVGDAPNTEKYLAPSQTKFVVQRSDRLKIKTTPKVCILCRFLLFKMCEIA